MDMAWFNGWRARRTLDVSRYRTQLADLPPGLEPDWRRSAPSEFQGIRTDAFFFARAAEGLMNFFDAVTYSGQPCALPSEAADSVWHAWLRHDPVGLERFCRRHFGAVVPHRERAGLGGSALLGTFAACHALDGGMPRKPRLPALFRLDARLRMRGGHGYWTCQGRIVYARIGPCGMGFGRARPHAELSTHALYMAGLVDRRALATDLGRRRQGQVGDGSCGSIACDSDGGFAFMDSGSGDGGDAGNSCGSSCGDD